MPGCQPRVGSSALTRYSDNTAGHETVDGAELPVYEKRLNEDAFIFRAHARRSSGCGEHATAPCNFQWRSIVAVVTLTGADRMHSLRAGRCPRG